MADESIPTEAPVTESQPPTPSLDPEVAAEMARMRAALKDANKEAAERRKRLAELEQAEEQRRAAEMTEQQKLQAQAQAAEKRAADAEAKARETLIRAAFVTEAAKAHALHPDDVYRLADLTAVDVTEAGAVTGVTEVVKALVDAGRVPLDTKPPVPDLDGGAGGMNQQTGRPQVRLTDEERQMARLLNMTPEAYAKRKAETLQ